MRPILLVPLLVTALVTFWLWRRLAVAPRWGSRVVTAVAAVVLVVLAAAMSAQFGAFDRFGSPAQVRPVAWLGGVWMGAWVYLLLGTIAVWLVTSVLALVRGRERSREVRVRVNRLGAPLVLLLALGTTAYGVARAADPTVTPVTVRSASLPAGLEGTRIALVTDLHAGAIRNADFTRTVVERVNAARPDLVVLGGDLIDGAQERFGPEIEPLRDLRAPLGVVAVTGNHEMYAPSLDPWLKEWRDLGVTVLANSSVRRERGGASLTVAGVQDWSGQGALAPDPDAALAGVSPEAFTVLVAHQPRQAFSVQGRGVDLQLSGHTHCGQLWPGRLFVPVQQPMVGGLGEVAGTPVLTSCGAGAWGPPVRVGADPQIPVVTLTR